MRLKGWALALISVALLYFSFSSLKSIAFKSKQSLAHSEIVVVRENPYRRLNTTLLTSVLAHIRVGYVANRTPDIDTPPLLVVYNCRHDECGPSLEGWLMSITSAYIFSMLWDGSAFAVDMESPVKLEWYFETDPKHMSMTPGQVEFYSSQADPSTVLRLDQMPAHELSTTDFMARYRSDNVKIMSCSRWDPWWHVLNNPSMKHLRDKYRLGQLTHSEGFWVVSRLLFNKPSEWLAGHLEPYRDLMGGQLYVDPLSTQAKKPSWIQERWMRIGVRITNDDNGIIECIAGRAANVCNRAQVMGKECHVFLSATLPETIDALQRTISERWQKINNHRPLMLHAVANSYQFKTSPVEEEDDELRRKLMYVRPVMDWLILSRMDFLLGTEGDAFLRTAAWAAQVETELYYDDEDDACHLEPMTDW